MKTITFKYTKKDGHTSERTLLALVTPSDKYAGIDVSELEPEQAAEFIALATELHNQYLSKLRQIQMTYDIKHNYRQFFADRMTDIDEI